MILIPETDEMMLAKHSINADYIIKGIEDLYKFFEEIKMTGDDSIVGIEPGLIDLFCKFPFNITYLIGDPFDHKFVTYADGRKFRGLRWEEFLFKKDDSKNIKVEEVIDEFED